MLVEDDVVFEYIKNFIPLIIVVSIIFAICIGAIIFVVIREKVIKPNKIKKNPELAEKYKEVPVKESSNKFVKFWKKWWKIIVPVTAVTVGTISVAVPFAGVNKGKNEGGVIETPDNPGGEDKPDKPAFTVGLNYIKITKMPTKLEYVVGEVFDPTGLEITAVYYNEKGEKEERVVTDYKLSKGPEDKLAYDDSKVEVTFTDGEITKRTMIKIIVDKAYPKIQAVIDKTGEYYVEVEDLSSKKWVPQPGREGMFFEQSDAKHVHGGGFVGSLSTGTIIELGFELKEEMMITAIGAFAKYEADYNLNDSNNFTLDGEKVTAEVVKYGKAPGKEFTNFKETEIFTKKLAKGEHKLVMTVTGQGPNIDYFKYKAISAGDAGKIVTNIKVTKAPTRTIYADGETFNKDGMEVSLVYGDGSTKVTNDYKVNAPTKLTQATKSIIVEAAEKKIEYPIYVVNRNIVNGTSSLIVEAENTLNTLWKVQEGKQAIQIPTTKTGSKMNLSNLAKGTKLVAALDLKKAMNINVNAMMAHKDAAFSLANNIKFTFDGTVANAKTTSFGNTTETTKTWKPVTFDTASAEPGLHFFTMEVIKEGLDIDCFNFDMIEKTDTRVLDHIEITKQPTKLVYALDDKFDPAGMEVTAHYTNGTKELVTGYAIEDTSKLNKDDKSIGIRYLGKTASVNISMTTKKKIETPDNTNNKIFYYNSGNNYIEIDRIGGKGKSLFQNYTDHISIKIYDSVDANINNPLASVKLSMKDITAVGGNVATLSSSDGKRTVGIDGESGNLYTGGNNLANIQSLVKYELGTKYNKANSYYFAFQVVAKKEKIGGMEYADSNISVISNVPFIKAESSNISIDKTKSHQMFGYNPAGYIEVDRQPGESIFGKATDYVLVKIFDDAKADVNKPLATMKIVYIEDTPDQQNTTMITSMDGTQKVMLKGWRKNIYTEKSNLQKIFDIIKKELGTKYDSKKSYYTAVQIIAKKDKVDGKIYKDSETSNIDTAAFMPKVEEKPAEPAK